MISRLVIIRPHNNRFTVCLYWPQLLFGQKAVVPIRLIQNIALMTAASVVCMCIGLVYAIRS